MSIIGNLIWFLFGGIFIAATYFIGGLLMMVTIIGIPFGLQAFKLGVLALWPFNSKVVPTGNTGGCVNTFLNVIWLLTFGLTIALEHAIIGIIFFITIIGIPFGKQHFKLARLALTPFGFTVI